MSFGFKALYLRGIYAEYFKQGGYCRKVYE